MRLTNNSLPVSSFEKAKKGLEAGMNVHIDDIKEDITNGTIELIYSAEPLPKITKVPPLGTLRRSEIFVGETRSKKITSRFDKIPHLLIAGQTGGGKSTFLRQLITTLIVNQKSRDITLIDLKGGLEFQTFKQTKGVTVVPNIGEAVSKLQSIQGDFNNRLLLLQNSQCKDIDQYNEKIKKENETGTPNTLIRKFIVIDEAAELFLNNSRHSSDTTHLAREVVVRLATQGRALGIHLIIATQRPDTRALDPQVKANLMGIICFQMANTASSMTVLGNGRAKNLPSIAGRAIWKSGLEMIEIQTPFMDLQSTEDLIRPFQNTDTKKAPEDEPSKPKRNMDEKE